MKNVLTRRWRVFIVGQNVESAVSFLKNRTGPFSLLRVSRSRHMISISYLGYIFSPIPRRAPGGSAYLARSSRYKDRCIRVASETPYQGN